MTVYLNHQFLPKSEARISPDDRGFLFGDGVYEVVRFYHGRFFEAAAHWQRFDRSLAELRMSRPAALDYEKVCHELIVRNGMETKDGYVYLQITRGAAPRNHSYAGDLEATVYGYATELPRNVEKLKQGFRVVFHPDLRWARCDIKSVALLANVLAAQHAREQGAEEAILLRGEQVTEASRSNVAIVKDGVVRTHPLTEGILNGITRQVVVKLCTQLGIPLQEESFTRAEMLAADEVFLMGTTVEVMPVVEVEGQKVAQGQAGPVTRRLQTAFEECVNVCRQRA
ncbi:MAG: D-alanine aminotransferase [Verrucomicrobia bacterium]|jgi:D-alanine transaminase|nr:D-alanine aminotransferase [Verrucomicrobiota bacterium]